jgi:phosphatidylserine/phosphatidylglycerophosphate/cardiolipin synthase-like enzyme
MSEDTIRRAWFLTSRERGNPWTKLDDRHGGGVAWTEGNEVTPLVHGATYFARLYEVLCDLERGDWVHFTDWRGDSDERLAGAGTEVGRVLADLARRGVQVKGLIWRSHPAAMKFSEEENLELARIVNEAGGEVLLDERVRRGGSHHQKLFLVRHPKDEDRDIAFVGGIDLCHGRHDDERHLGDPQVYRLDERYGQRPPWHDVQLQIRGPSLTDLALTFRERWEDPTPLDHRNPVRRAMRDRAHEPDQRSVLPPLASEPRAVGLQAVQVLRTYPYKRPPFPFAPNGERSIARAYRKAYARARKLIYLEDQYFWSSEVPGILAETMRDSPDLHLVVVLPRFPEQDNAVAGPTNRAGQRKAIERVLEAGGDRVGIYDIENEAGTPIYVHAKVCIVDDVWCMVGSDNVNLRSWTHDSELSCAILDHARDGREPIDPAGLGDGARAFARNLRLELWREHLGLGDGDPPIDPHEGFEAFRHSARSLDAWHASGRQGPRPPGRVREHRLEDDPLILQRLAYPAYRVALDPDGRPRRMRKKNVF